MLEIIIKIFGTILFFTPGILLDLILFKKSTWLKRTAFSIALSGSIATIIGMTLVSMGELKLFPTITVYVFLSLTFLIMLISKKNYKREIIQTFFSKEFIYILTFSLVGTIWKIFLNFQQKISGDAYGYASYLISKSIKETGSLKIQIPDLHFYTGMVGGHASYIGGTVSKIIIEQITINSRYLNIFMGTLMYVGFSFLVVFALTKKPKLAYMGAAIMALGPIELWRTTQGFVGHPLSYIALFSLFLLFIYGELSYFLLALFVCLALIPSYYTGAMMIMIVSVGFWIANFISCCFEKKNSVKEVLFSLFTKRAIYFILIALISWLFVSEASNAKEYTMKNFKTTASIITSSIAQVQKNQTGYENSGEIGENSNANNKQASTMPMPDYHYTGPFQIWGFPLIAIEDLIFLFFGLTFVLYFIFIKRENQDVLMALCCIPVALLSIAFIIVNSPERSFYYFTFFAIAGIRIPKEYLKYIAVFLMIITIIFAGLRYYKRPYLTKFESEIEAAEFVKQNLNETVFTDQHFANILILNDYYDVQGISDVDTKTIPIYRECNLNENIKALNSLNAKYIAITKRMREIYILSLNLPQKPMFNSEMYENNYSKIYDNGDVKIYQIPEIKQDKN